MRWQLALVPLLMCAGCAGRRMTVVEAFPPASVATPWVLRDAVWTGTFDEAATALGDDAKTWQQFGATHVWLAIYCHETEPNQCLTVRCFAFDSVSDAQQAYDIIAPLAPKPFQAGDVGCWTEIGVLFQWRRLVFDIFGSRASWDNQVQATYLATLIAKRMPPGMPDNPQ